MSIIFFFPERWKLNTLSGLVNYFTEKQGKHVALESPIIEFTIDSDKSDGT